MEYPKPKETPVNISNPTLMGLTLNPDLTNHKQD